MQGAVTLATDGKRDRYGRLLVQAPELQARLLAAGLAQPSDGQRKDWCRLVFFSPQSLPI